MLLHWNRRMRNCLKQARWMLPFAWRSSAVVAIHFASPAPRSMHIACGWRCWPQGNPNFVRDASALVHPEKGAILYCSLGGSLEPTENSKKGQQSRCMF